MNEAKVLNQSTNLRNSKDLPYFSDATAPGGTGPPFHKMINPGMGPNPSNPQPPINYHSSAYKRPNIFINKRIGEVGVELEPHKRLPQQVVNPQFRPMTNQMAQHQQPGFLQQLFGLGGSESGITRPTSNIPTSPGGTAIPPQHIRPPYNNSCHINKHISISNKLYTMDLKHLEQFRKMRYLLGAIENWYIVWTIWRVGCEEQSN
ncbi:hypothetical protein EVAR_69768_1 [Eumeta japonica]|uniref:Uncharacterized protein n=1 Tax=Eumeta variegata TaxID=151549 RepID=A0A4C1T0F5_EUMVA|nr:hypothetical protein EVAR_69768_1 [Eumeta japonica]